MDKETQAYKVEELKTLHVGLHPDYAKHIGAEKISRAEFLGLRSREGYEVC